MQNKVSVKPWQLTVGKNGIVQVSTDSPQLTTLMDLPILVLIIVKCITHVSGLII